MLTLLIVAAALGAATIGGVFFAFSTFVMRALGQLPPTQGVAAMQRINVVVLNPMFLGTFVGTAVLQALVAVLAISGWGSPALDAAPGRRRALHRRLLRRDDRLQRAAQRSAEGADGRVRRPRTSTGAIYLREWTVWNHVRTAAALAAAACGAGRAGRGMSPDGRTRARAVLGSVARRATT